MKKTNFLLGGALLLVALFTTSCDKLMSKLDNPVSPYLELEQTTANLEYGQSITIKPTSINDQNPIYTYESLNPEIATVDEATGVVTAVDYDGEATIVAKIAANEYYQAGQTEFKVTVSTPAEKTPLSFEAKNDGIITVKFNGGVALAEPIIATTKGVQTEITKETEISVTAGQKVRFSSKNASMTNNTAKFVQFATTDTCFVYGNVMSLISEDGNFATATELTTNATFAGLFKDAINLLNNANCDLVLPATTITKQCYYDMFNGCVALTKAPALPAEEMKETCYYQMFYNCQKLEAAPALPAKTLAKSCYNAMFKNCKSIVAAPTLSAENLAENCYYDMFNGCSKLAEAPELKAEVMVQSCYYNMFKGCKALTKAPELPAKTLASNCYRYMFQNCTALISVSDLPAETLQGSCYYGMFQGCTALVKAPEIEATKIASTNSCRQMFYGCTSLTTPPSTLPGTLSSGGSDFYSMFRNCTSLTTAPILPATTLPGSCYREMFYGCTSLTATPSLPALKISTRSYQDMFNGCSNLSLVMCNATSGMKTSNNTSNWLKGVKSTGNFFKNSAAGTAKSGDDVWNTDNDGGIPAGWDVYNL